MASWERKQTLSLCPQSKTGEHLKTRFAVKKREGIGAEEWSRDVDGNDDAERKE